MVLDVGICVWGASAGSGIFVWGFCGVGVSVGAVHDLALSDL